MMIGREGGVIPHVPGCPTRQHSSECLDSLKYIPPLGGTTSDILTLRWLAELLGLPC